MFEPYKFYYFEKMPIDELFIPGITMKDQRLNDPIHFQHKFEAFKRLYGYDVRDDMKTRGLIDPLIGLYENRRWRIEPGQARWLALWYNGVNDYKAVIFVRPEDDFSYYLKFDHTEIKTEKELYELFTDSRDKPHVGFNYLINRYEREKNT
jgi:hypothetical protein